MRFIFKEPRRRAGAAFLAYRWDARRRVYLDRNGRKVPDARLRANLEAYITEQKEVIRPKAAKMVAGTLATGAFFGWMRDRVETMHRLGGVTAYGGPSQMTPERWKRVELKVLEENKYLTGFELDVAAEPALAESLWPIDRATRYADSVYSTYENNVKAREKDAGLLSGRRVCVDDESSCEDCPALATEDYLPLDQVADIGDSQCASRCRCWVEFDYAGVEPLTIDRGVYA